MSDKPFDLERLTDLTSGYWPARAVLTAQELGFFAALGEGPAEAGELAARVSCNPRSTELLADALVGLGLLEKHDREFRNGPFAAAHLVPGRGDYLGGYLEHHLTLWQTWSGLTEAVRTGAAAHAPRPAGSVRSFIMAMHTSSRIHAEAVVDQLDLDGVRRVLDVGGGSGDYAYALLGRLPEATAVILDRPDVLPVTRECAELAGVSDRVETRAGDYWEEELGEGFDLALVSNILHSSDPDGCEVILGKALRALRPGGQVVVHDFVLTEDGTKPTWASLFSLNMLTGGSRGRSYTHAELREMLAQAGFEDVTHVPMEGDSEILVARRAL